MRSRLETIPGVRVHDIGTRRCGIVGFSLDGVDALDVETRLRHPDIHVSLSSPASTLIDAKRRGLPDLVRASVHYFNEDAEIERLVEVVAGMAD